MSAIPADTQVHLGPTVAGNPFLTRGHANGVAGGWQLKSGLMIVGSGIDVTTLQLVGAATADTQYYAMGHALKFTSPASANLLDGVEISDLTIDCALHAQPVTVGKYAPVACGAIRLLGSHGRWKGLSVDLANAFEASGPSRRQFGPFLDLCGAALTFLLALPPWSSGLGW